MVEHAAVNRGVVGSSPTRGVQQPELSYKTELLLYDEKAGPKGRIKYGSLVKRLRHRPFTAVTRVRFPSESFIRINPLFGPLAQLVRATGS